MAAEVKRVRWTHDDLLLLPDDGKRHELIGGVHFVTASPALKHQRVSMRLFLRLHASVERLGEVFYAPCDVVFSSFDVVVPDLLYVSRERAGILTGANLQGAPDLVIEILSPSTRERDRGIKRDLYERSGVKEYWIVDPEKETVHVWRAEGGRFGRPLELGEVETLTTPLLPGLEIPLREIFRD